jgi:hypothetical protein
MALHGEGHPSPKRVNLFEDVGVEAPIPRILRYGLELLGMSFGVILDFSVRRR